MTSRFLLTALALLCLPAAARADQLVMNNGSILVGTLVSADESQVIFNTPFADDITIKKDNIKTISTDGDVTILMQDGTIYREKRIVEQGEDLIVLVEDAEPAYVSVPDVRLLNPEPWRLGDGYKWSGEVNAALSSERGNTDTDELDLGLDSVWRSLRDRYTIRGLWEIDESNGDRNKYRWLLRNKYDRFSKEDADNYLGIQSAFEHDEFADLDLRSLVGPYVGRQFFETGYLDVQGEVGVVYVDEQFDMAEDDHYWGATWELRYISGLIPGIELYAFQTGIYNFSDTDNLVMNTRVGARFPLIYGFSTSAEAVYEYDAGAVEGVDTTDETYRFRLGYNW